MLLLLLDLNNDKKTLKDIIKKTFKGLQILINPTKKYDNNFNEKIDEIALYRGLSLNYSILFKNAFNEIAQSEQDILLAIDKIDLETLSSVGLSKNNLKIKVQVYKESIYKLNSHIENRADFGNIKTIKFFLESIDNLLNILESLKTIIPGLELLIELIKLIKSLLFLLENNIVK